MKRYVVGDIHGAHKALLQCLKEVKFDYEKDELVCLGDVADGWPGAPQCVEELRKIKNLIYIMGNHDFWLMEWLDHGATPTIWTEQGGLATLDAYREKNELIIDHKNFFDDANYYFIDEDNRIFVHGGFQRGLKLSSQTPEMFMWDRSLATKAVHGSASGFTVHEFKEVFLGHTTVNSFNIKPKAQNNPIFGGNVILLDTGAGWEGRLTIMDIVTKEYWQSDIVSDLYPEFASRSGKRAIWERLYNGKL
jgi:serine/threonine protein phosphatase 1